MMLRKINDEWIETEMAVESKKLLRAFCASYNSTYIGSAGNRMKVVGFFHPRLLDIDPFLISSSLYRQEPMHEITLAIVYFI